MSLVQDPSKLIEELRTQEWAWNVSADESFWTRLGEWLEDSVLSDFLREVVEKVDAVLGIEPARTEAQILEQATRIIVGTLGAQSASVRIYDPHTHQMLSYGSFPPREEARETYVPLEGSIAGEVVKTGQPVVVPDIGEDARYRNKNGMIRRGVNSLLGVPLEIPRFYPQERDTVGVIQIYYEEKGRNFSPVEIQMAYLLARRLSFVIARKKIHSLQQAGEKKEMIAQQIFRTLRTRGGVKIKEIFTRILPGLADLVNLQSAALFRVSQDLSHVTLEAGYPEAGGYHSVGMRFGVAAEPVFEILLNLRTYEGDSLYEVVTPSYVLVVDPARSPIISENLKRFALDKHINSILYIPLGLEEQITHILTFDALEQRKRYAEDEIDVFLFLGRELMKAKEMERLDDALHDFKNPAIAVAGFARRLKRLLEEEELLARRSELLRYAEILEQETTRLQELAMSIYQVGEEQVLDLTEILRRRFEINKEAIREQLRQNIVLEEGPFAPELMVRGYPIHLERVFDNLLNNATKAIPLAGGRLAIRSYADGEWACAEITNTGTLPETERVRIMGGEGEGRGLYITHRIMGLLGGEIQIREGDGTTTFAVRLPLQRPA